jgi:hypothetical protein
VANRTRPALQGSLPSSGLQTVSITAVKRGTAAGHQVCVSITAVKTPATANWSRCCHDEARYAQRPKQSERYQQILAGPHDRALDQETQDASRPMPHRAGAQHLMGEL